jgi:putative addiction module killer protein
MKTISNTGKFANWMAGLARKDQTAAAIVAQRIERLKQGLGDVEAVGEGVSELRIHTGPGYRVYFGELGGVVIVVLAGGTKKRQQADIDEAKSMFAEIKKQFAAQQVAKTAVAPTAKSGSKRRR